MEMNKQQQQQLPSSTKKNKKTHTLPIHPTQTHTVDQITEGKATVKLINESKTFEAFYNPAQELNRDLTILAVNTYFTFTKYKKQKEINSLPSYKFSICEPLSATGLRGMRYFTEIPESKLSLIVNNDMDINAVDCIKQNMKLNNVNENIFKVYQQDANHLLYTHPKAFDVIDLDPYGSAIPFIDSCIYASKNNALLCLTFTDMPVLCGNYPETTLYKYGVIPYKSTFCHEMAKRIALYAISSNASKYKKVIKPLLSYNADFYIRLFILIKDSAEDCKRNPFKYGYMYHCRSCQNRTIIPMASYQENKFKNGKPNSFVKFNNLIHERTHCELCNSAMCMSGPFWIDDLHDEDFITSLKETLNQKEFDYLKYKERIHLILKSIGDEMKLKDEIFYYDYSQCNRDVNLSSFKLSLFEGALNSLKYNMEQSYYDPNLFKTNAPCSVIYDILKKYKKSNYDEEDYLKNVKESSYKHNILIKDIKVEPVFKEAVKEKALKYPMHPFANWGPKGKAKEKKQDE